MQIEALGSATSAPRRPLRPLGITAELAEQRATLREAAPPGRWNAVQAEVHRLQFDQGMSPLAALQAVYARLASGWVPLTPR